MDFSSIPPYLDASNWQQTPPPPQHQHQHHLHHQQQLQHHHGGGSNLNPNTNSNPLLSPPAPPLQQGPQPGPMGSSIRPGSMAERARMANIPMPEPALKCPRCESTNTKFCYFNNYSLSQPRHFCKTCRRYWTRGGALRSVPVGGGCRRNKRSKSSSSAGGGGSSSKSAASDRSASAAASSGSSALSAGMAGTSSMADIMGLTPPPLSALRFMSPLHHVTDFGGYGGGISAAAGELGFQLGNIGGGGMEHQWRIPGPPQFPFLDSAAPVGGSGLYGHHYDGMELSSLGIGHVRSKGLEAASAAVKTEGSGGAVRQEMNLARQFNLGMLSQHGNVGAGEHFNWGGAGAGGSSSSGGGGNAWTDMSGINNSSCSTTSAM